MEDLISISINTVNKTVKINESLGGSSEHAVYSARIEEGNLILINSVTIVKRFSAPFNTVLINGSSYADEQDCLDALEGIGNFYNGGVVNNSGQIKVDYTGLNIVGVQSDTDYIFPLHTAIATVSASPVTKYPIGSAKAYNPAMFIPGINPPTTMRLRENNKEGQVHTWRIIGTYIGKTAGNNGALDFKLVNPDINFEVESQLTLPSGRTGGKFSVDFITIASNFSLAENRGYQLFMNVSFSDINLEVNIESITRISLPTENE